MLRKSTYIYALIIFAVFFIFGGRVYAAFVFNNNLKLGDTGQDVFELQKVLNNDLSTAVSLDGPGSKGNETYYFGEKTKSAVMAFQNKYANEILTPNGLFSGTGFVGVSTRAKLNSLSSVVVQPDFPALPPSTSSSGDIPPEILALEALLASANTESVSPQSLMGDLDLSSAQANSVGFDGKGKKYTPAFKNYQKLVSSGVLADSPDSLQISFLSTNMAKYGEPVTVSGAGFSLEKNDVIFGSNKIENVPAVSSNQITFTLPANIPAGIYDLQVSNSLGTTKSKQYFVVVDSSVPSPKILSIQPTKVSIGDEVTIYGENFTSSGNQVHTSLGVITGLSSADGKTLKFELESPENIPGFESVFEENDDFELQVLLYVVNIHGISDRNGPAIMTLK